MTGPAAPPVAVINQTMARQMFAGRGSGRQADPVRTAGGAWTTIVGVIGDVRHSGLESAPAPEVYIWYLQNPPVNPFLVVRTAADPAALAAAVRAAAAGARQGHRGVRRPADDAGPRGVRAQRRFILLLVGAFGALALVMAAVGVFGVMALVVSERTPEIGIRLALGRPSRAGPCARWSSRA